MSDPLKNVQAFIEKVTVPNETHSCRNCACRTCPERPTDQYVCASWKPDTPTLFDDYLKRRLREVDTIQCETTSDIVGKRMMKLTLLSVLEEWQKIHLK